MKKSATLAAIVGALLIPQLAQAEIVTLTDEQIMLNNEAVKAANAGNFEKAEQIFSAMSQIQESDIIWLQLGRMYEKQGKCLKSRDAYDRVDSANQTLELPHEIIMERLVEYRISYAETCSSSIVIDCTNKDIMVSIDGDTKVPCSSNPIPVTKGTHEVLSETPYGSNTVKVTATEDHIASATVEVINYKKVAQDYQNGVISQDSKLGTEYGVESKPTSNALKIAGWTLLGVGAAGIVAGGVYYGMARSDYNDLDIKQVHDEEALAAINKEVEDINGKYDIGYTIMGIGGAVAVTGAVLLIVDALKSDSPLSNDASASNFTLLPYVNSESAGMGLLWNF